MKKSIRKVVAVVLSVSLFQTSLSAGLFDSIKDFSSINSTIENILNNLDGIKSDLDGVFDGFSVEAVSEELLGDEELLGCLLKTDELDKVLGEMLSADGMCNMFNWADEIDKLFNNDVTACFGLSGASVVGKDNAKALDDIMNTLKSFCGYGTKQDEFGVEHDTWGGDVALNADNKIRYDPMAIVTTGTPEIGAVIMGAGDKTTVKIEDAKYPNGRTVEQVFGFEGDLHKELEDNPNSSTAEAYSRLKKETLGLKVIAAKFRTGDNQFNEDSIALPANHMLSIKASNDISTLVAFQSPDYYELLTKLISEVRTKYKEIDVSSIDTLSDYYKEEKKAYTEVMKESKTLETFRRNAVSSARTFYQQKLTKLMKSDDYLMIPSEEVAGRLSKEKQNVYRFRAFLQTNDEAHIKTGMAIAGRIITENIERVRARVYPASSIFRADIAKKEINEMLKAVDAEVK